MNSYMHWACVLRFWGWTSQNSLGATTSQDHRYAPQWPTVHCKATYHPRVFNTPRPLLHFKHTVSFGAHCSQTFTTWPSERASPHHKVVMHVFSTVHGSNEPWQWMLSGFNRLHPHVPPTHPTLPPPQSASLSICVRQNHVKKSQIHGLCVFLHSVHKHLNGT